MSILPRSTVLLTITYCSSLLAFAARWETDGFHVLPGDRIQDALDEAARNPTNKTVKVHAGTYRPETKRQALLWFNQVHDGIRLEAVGEVTLTAANPELSEAGSSNYPAVVNHVVYFGDGISEHTIIQGFRITGANDFVTTALPTVETSRTFKKDLYFFTDGGAIKIFGRSFPTLRQLEIVDNFSSPCAGGISVQHKGDGVDPGERAVRMEDCVFLRNRSQVTGAAVDLLPGSCAVISNCLFVSNVANQGTNYISPTPDFTNSAPLTVFPTSRAIMQRCTFANNRNGVEDLGRQSVYQGCIFWHNELDSAFYKGKRYALNIEETAKVSGCIFDGPVLAPEHVISKSDNQFGGPDPKFDSYFNPADVAYEAAGFRSGKLKFNLTYLAPKSP